MGWDRSGVPPHLFRGCPARSGTEPHVGAWRAQLLSTPSVPLHRCLNLAPAGTGTQALTAFLRALQTAEGQAPVAHHNHHVRAFSQIWNTTWLLNRTRCLIVTLRDPAERLASGMRWDAATCDPMYSQQLQHSKCPSLLTPHVTRLAD